MQHLAKTGENNIREIYAMLSMIRHFYESGFLITPSQKTLPGIARSNAYMWRANQL